MHQEGFRYDEIANRVGVAPGSVGTLFARALRSFTAVYHEVGDDDRTSG
jgi:DNA-directed RNA polymerase specialized sigma24 family protein